MDTIVTAPPKSHQVADLIRSEIASFGLKPKARLLTARQFAEKLSVSKQVVQSAFAILEKEGTIETRKRCGTFVAARVEAATRSAQGCLLLGLLLHSGCDAYGMAVVKAMHEAAAKYSLKLRTVCADNFGDDTLAAVEELRKEGCSALMIPWLPRNQFSDVATFIPKCSIPASIPLLLPGLEKHCTKLPGISNSNNGDTQIARTACEYFRRLGVNRIALLGPDTKGDIAMTNKIAGYSEYIATHGMESVVSLVGPFTRDMDALALRWSEYRGHLAIISYDDVHALRFITAMHKLGLSAPRDFKIIGDNDSMEAKFSDPPLTSGRADYARIGEEGVKCALALGRGEEWHSSWIGAKTLTVRESCGGLAHLTPEFIDEMRSTGLSIVIGEKAAEELVP